MKRRTGFTLVEALIAVAAGLLVIGLAVNLFGWAGRALTRADQHLDARETALRTISVVRDALVDARMYSIVSESAIDLQSRARSGKLVHDPATGRVTLGGEVIARGVSQLTFTAAGRGIVRVTLRIDRPKVENKMADLAPLTLVDDVLVPLVCLQAPDTPWQKVSLP
jgi:hypothetical protein